VRGLTTRLDQTSLNLVVATTIQISQYLLSHISDVSENDVSKLTSVKVTSVKVTSVKVTSVKVTSVKVVTSVK